MNDIFIAVWMFFLGAVFGSYAVATVWRLRAKELANYDVDELNETEKKEYKKLVQKAQLSHQKFKTDKSQCLHCQHRLAWYDLIPVLSWVMLRGKCRYCGGKIGSLELITEVVLGLVFSMSYVLLLGDFGYAGLFLWLILLVILTILFIYDEKWQLLPTRLLWLGIFVATLFAFVMGVRSVSFGMGLWQLITNCAMSMMLLGGLYFALAAISKQAWVGGGDGYLGVIMALVIADVRLSMVALFLANLTGCLVVLLKSLIYKKPFRGTKIAFGPMLIFSLIIVVFCQTVILQNFNLFFVDIY